MPYQAFNCSGRSGGLAMGPGRLTGRAHTDRLFPMGYRGKSTKAYLRLMVPRQMAEPQRHTTRVAFFENR
jgi:hypothetical protein